jgi:hypothetical protein
LVLEIWFDDMIFSVMLECLGILFEKSENSLKSSSLICHSPTKPI